MRKVENETCGPAERRRECAKGKLKANGQQMHITNRKKMGGSIGFLCDVLSNYPAWTMST